MVEKRMSYGYEIDYKNYRPIAFHKEYVAGLDLGQKQDYSALVLIERTRTVYDARDPVSYDFIKKEEYRLVHAERMPLGTSYTGVVDRVCRVVNGAPGRENLALLVDATGVGGPVVDLLRRSRPAGRLVPVTITAGDCVKEERGAFRVPKRDIIAALQVAFEEKRLLLQPDLPAVEILISELMAMRATVTAKGHERIEAWREGAHDDLVLAVALAWWWCVFSEAALSRQRNFGERPFRLL
jgi:hypothetical protein